MARVLLISYPGYPSTPRHLVLNNWLADNAAVLRAEGHAVLALDYGTVSMMRRLFPEALTAQLKPLAAAMMGGGGQPDAAQMAQLLEWSNALDAHQKATAGAVTAELVNFAQEWRPDLIAFELGDGDGYSESAVMAEQLHGALPSVHVTAGGRKAAWFRGLILRSAAGFDSMIFGDPETSLLQLAAAATGTGDIAEIPGIVFRTGSGEQENPRADCLDLGSLPLPAYDAETYPAMAGDEKIKLAILTESRGCPNRCAYCVHPMEDGGQQRVAPARTILDTIEGLQNAYGLSVFRFGGASTPAELMYEVAQGIIERGLKVQYNSFGHFRTANPEHYATLAQSGLYSLFFGLESGSQTILDRAVHKGVKLDLAREAVKAAKAAGIFTAASIIVPLPFDNEETLAESVKFVTELQPDSVPLQFPGVFPQTPWIEHPERYNIEIDNPEQYLLDNLDYKVKLLFPPQFWQPLPYRINGLSFHEMTAVTMKFAHDLESAGILTNFSHTLAAIAKSAGMAPRELRDMAQLWCLTGDTEAMGGMVSRANRAMVHN